MYGNKTLGDIVIDVFYQTGLTTYVFPFLLVFAALYAVTMKIKILTDNPVLNGIVSAAIAYAFVSFGGGEWLNALLPLFMVFALILIVILLLYRFFGATEEQILSVFKNPVIVLLVVGFVVLLVFVALQDWLIYSDRIPAWRVNESGQLLPEGQIANGTKPHVIVVNGVQYELINGIYYKQGYEGTAYALGSPVVIGGIILLAIIGIAVALIIMPKE